MNKVVLDSIIFGLQRFGGISNYWRNIINWNARTIYGDSTTIIYPSNTNSFEELPSINSNINIIVESFPVQLTRYADVFHVPGDCDVFHSSYFRLPVGKVKNRVITVYDFTYEKFMSGIQRRVHSWQKFKAIRSADTIICISNSTRCDLIEFLPNIDLKRVHVVPLAVDRSIYHQPSLRESSIEDVILFVGGRTKFKRFDLAVDAVALVSNFRLGVIGPPLTAEEKLMLNRKLGNRWLEFGLMRSTDLKEVYGSVFAFIFPSDYEGFGLPILEAMACGCPVICSKSSSLPEVGGDAAFYAEDQDPSEYARLIREIESDSIRGKAICMGFTNIEKYSWDETCRLTQSLYRG
jgi:mannosyltransferase